MSDKRVLMVSSLWPPVRLGGAEGAAHELAVHLRDAGHEVRVVTLGVPGADVIAQVTPRPYRLDEFEHQPARRRLAFHVRDLYRRETTHVLEEVIRTFRPDVVHTHSVAGLSSTALAAPSRLGVGHVHTLHDYWLLCQRSSLVARDGTVCDRRCINCTLISRFRNGVIERHPPHVVLAVSDAIAAEHVALGWMGKCLRVVRNPIASRVPVARRPVGPLPTFGYLGRLTPTKGVHTLLAAFRAAGIPGARLIIGGDGPLRAELAAEGTDGVEIEGWLDADARERFFERVDCLVVPSEWKDPAPLVLNEAAARGVPVIGSRIGGIPELVSESCDALLFQPGDADELAERLLEYARAPERFPGGARSDALNWGMYLERILTAYEDAGRAAAMVRERSGRTKS